MSDGPASKRSASTSTSPPPPLPGEKRAGRGAAAFVVTPFARLARSHAAGMGGDALVAIALADSLFFSIDPNDARWRVALYLLLTVAPFGVVAPWLGPAMDRLRGGHRFMLVAAAAARSLLAVGMAVYVDSLLLFPFAFAMLVMGKTHHIAKSAMVPATVRDDAGLVQANSRLSIISSVSAGLAGIPGVLLLALGGARWTLGLAAMMFLAAAMLATRIPAVTVADSPAGAEEKAEMRGSGIVLAASAMGYVRGVVGFLTMLLAFELRGGVDPGPIGAGVEIGHRVRESLGSLRLDLSTGGAPAWHFGVVLLATGLGGLGGAFSSPRLRQAYTEERLLAGALGLVGVFGFLAALAGGLLGAILIAFAVATAGQVGKQSFDAIVQRDAKEANLGRSFAKFESRFQLLWVFGALVPVVLPIPSRLGFAVLAATASFAAASYWLGRDPSPRSASARRVSRTLREKLPTPPVVRRNRERDESRPDPAADQTPAEDFFSSEDPTDVMPTADEMDLTPSLAPEPLSPEPLSPEPLSPEPPRRPRRRNG